jgi:hypothetical protein
VERRDCTWSITSWAILADLHQHLPPSLCVGGDRSPLSVIHPPTPAAAVTTLVGAWIPFTLPALSTNPISLLRLGTGVTGTSDTYFVSFRAPVAFDFQLPTEARNMVQVRAEDDA